MKNFALFLIAILFPVIGIAQKKYEFQNDENYKAYQKMPTNCWKKKLKFALLKNNEG